MAALRDLTQSMSDPITWCVAPFAHTWGARQPHVMSGAVEISRDLVLSMFGLSAIRIVQVEDITFVWTSENQRRTLEPLAQALGATPRPRRPPGRWGPGLLSGARRARAAALRLVTSGEEAGLDLASVPVSRAASRASRAMAVAPEVLRSSRLLVVASQHDPAIRAFLHVAESIGESSVYLPHAPLASNPLYADLPVGWAGLRGEAEVDYYAALGADRGRLRAVGNVTLGEAFEMPDIDPNIPIVFAVSPVAPELFAPQVELLRSTIDRPVLVAPHPRSDIRRLRRQIPRHWEVWAGGRSWNLLLKGPSTVIQFSSGLAWEALILGIPVIELHFPGLPPNYPLIAEPHVFFASDHHELADAVQKAQRRSMDHSQRAALVRWAQSWCRDVGVPATQQALALLREARDHGAQPRLLDGWRNA